MTHGALKSRKIKVCHLASGDLWAGAEVQLATLLSCLVKYPQFSLEAIILNEGKLAKELRGNGIDVTVIDETNLNGVLILKELLSYFQTHRVDILHTHKYKENILGGIAARIRRVPFIVRTIHGLPEPFCAFSAAKMAVYRSLDYFVNYLAVDRIVTVSKDIRDKLAETYNPEKLICIHNGVQIEKYEEMWKSGGRRCDNSIRIGYVGRLTEVKGLEFFIKAAKIILSQNAGQNIKFLIVGDGPLKNSLEALALNLGIEHDVIFLGHRYDCDQLTSEMSIVVLPSLSEGIPMSLLEALSLGKPVVATRVGGVPEVIEDGVNGVLVGAGDETAIARACTSMINNYSWAEQLGMNGKKIIEKQFSAKANAENIAQLYKSLKSR
jgi:glycosyltransferase involved in cell wall biosynthesis